MKFDYAPIVQDVLNALEEFGKPMTIFSEGTEGAYDPVTGEETEGTPGGSMQFMGLEMELTEEYTQSVGAGNVEASDLLIMASPNINPDPSDHIVIDEEIWDVVAVHRTKPGDTVLFYTLQVRR